MVLMINIDFFCLAKVLRPLKGNINSLMFSRFGKIFSQTHGTYNNQNLPSIFMVPIKLALILLAIPWLFNVECISNFRFIKWNHHQSCFCIITMVVFCKTCNCFQFEWLTKIMSCNESVITEKRKAKIH